jgi:peptidyl-prolyl cis-trans isomerase SurA
MERATFRLMSAGSAAAMLCLTATIAGGTAALAGMPGVSIDSGGFPGAAPPPQPQPAPQAAPAQAPEAKPAAKPAKPAKAPAAKPKPKPQQSAAADPSADDGKGGRPGLSIAVLVNDEPITAYEIEQRAAFMALQGGAGGDFKAKAEARWKSIMKDPKTNERFKELLKKNNVTTQEEAKALQTQFIKQLQQNMVEGLKREARSAALAGSRDKARDELIEEKIKMQEAKRLNALAEDDDVNKILSGIAERNKMTLEQFTQHMKGMGANINTMRSRFKAEMSWREVVRRRFGHMVAITERDVDKFVASAPAGGPSADDVELQVQRITLTMPAKTDQGAIGRRLAEADALASKYSGCATISALGASVTGAKFEDLGARKPSSIPEPTRSLLLNATEGDMLPPSVTSSGIELWALCSRKVLAADSTKRENAQQELRQREFEILAQKALKDLRQDAAIEIR